MGRDDHANRCARGHALADKLDEYIVHPVEAGESTRVYAMENVPAVADYVRALAALEGRISDRQRRLLHAHYQYLESTQQNTTT